MKMHRDTIAVHFARAVLKTYVMLIVVVLMKFI